MFHNPLSDAIVVLVILLLFFGPKRLPMLSRSIGESIREFKGGIGSGSADDDAAKPELSAQSPQPQSDQPQSERAGSAAPREAAEASTEHHA